LVVWSLRRTRRPHRRWSKAAGASDSGIGNHAVRFAALFPGGQKWHVQYVWFFWALAGAVQRRASGAL